ncbi:hypothetical protein IMCC20628_01897 [Hoeflea sp. IMCC20628]|nr:hypothetical protein IMCC20628_01897 [Hoeflea sp. IMCC20628]
MIVCLVLGAAGGYAAFRFLPSYSSTAHDEARAAAVSANDALAAARKDLDEARSIQQSDRAQLEALQATIARQAADLDAMTERLAAVSSQARSPEDQSSVVEALSRERDRLTGENESLKRDLAALQTERDAGKQSTTVAEARLEAELARLRDEVVPELTAERDRLNRKTLMMLADQTNLKAQAKAAADARAEDAKRIAELKTRLADAEGELTASQEVLDALKLESRAGQESESVTDSNAAKAATQPDAVEKPALDTRKPDAVAQALRTAPGLETLSQADLQRLTDTLIAGECVTTALKSVFDRVPILTLRNLIRDLNSDC